MKIQILATLREKGPQVATAQAGAIHAGQLGVMTEPPDAALQAIASWQSAAAA